jgi:CRISPR/Cas system-associated exonuclease Cas4 (RecB family)
MSASQLTEIELCPLKWALKRGSYPSIWSRRGYPSPFHSGSFNGQILHLALERIGETVSALNEGDSIISALRQLGGLSTIIKDCTADILRAGVRDNPRIRNISKLEEELRSQVPFLRERLQILLGSVTVTSQAKRTGEKVSTGDRRPLGNGSHFEVELKSETLRWTGRIDVIQITDESIEIVDFKTSEIKERDSEQLQIYALLWEQDRDLNPKARFANRLHLFSPARNVSLPGPSEDQLRAIERELRRRSDAAQSFLNTTPPSARANSECPDCDVRHLCELYWSSLKPIVDEGKRPPQRIDAEVVLNSRIGENNWNVEVERSSGMSPAKAGLRNSHSDPLVRQVLEAGNRFRILNAWLLLPTEADGSLPVLSLSDRSELFLL